MKIKLVRLLLVLCFAGIFWAFPVWVKAQGYYFYDAGHYEPNWVVDLSVNFGMANPVVDIGGSKISEKGLNAYTLRSPKLTGGVSVTATHRDIVAFRVDLAAGRLAAYDSLLKGATHFSAKGRYDRNLNFRANTFEAFVGVEFHPLFVYDYQNKGKYLPRFSPYIMAGVGILAWQTQTLYGNQWIDVKPLRLEGEGFAEYPNRPLYNSTTLTYPLGLGFRYEANRVVTLRGEILHKFTNTDNLDGVSWGDWVNPELFGNYLEPAQAALAAQLFNRSTTVNPPRNTRPRGNENSKDLFWNVQFRVGFALNRNRRN